MTEDELRAAFRALPPLEGELPYHTWHRHRQSLRDHVARDDPRQMLRWSTIVATMFVGTGAAFTPMELSRLTSRYLDAIAEPGIGSPELWEGWTSGNMIHQAYHLMQWEEATGRRIEDMESIVEIGGGYGAMALIAARLGFAGRYLIVDFPELALLQRYWLTRAGVLGVGHTRLDGLGGERPDLLIALYSITEMELPDRWAILDELRAPHLLLSHQPGFTPFKTKIDNVAWSAEMVRRYPGRYERRSMDLPGLEGHWYVLR